jgi:uncharacterized protein YndB with AHSA1/START domain
MTTQAEAATARASVIVDAPIERAFAVFTTGIDSWWPREHTIGEAALKEMVLEPKVGGRAYGIGVDGSESDWGRVLAFDPPNRIVVSWDINLAWKHELDPARASEFEVRFIPDGPDRTRVELEHRDLDRFGPDAERMHETFSAPGAWDATLAAFAAGVEGPAS